MTFRDGAGLRKKKPLFLFVYLYDPELHICDHLSEAYSRSIAAHVYLFKSKLSISKQFCVVERAQALKSNWPKVHPVSTT